MSKYLTLKGEIINDYGYNNTPIKINFTANRAANSYSQNYISISTTGGHMVDHLLAVYNNWLVDTSFLILLIMV